MQKASQGCAASLPSWKRRVSALHTGDPPGRGQLAARSATCLRQPSITQHTERLAHVARRGRKERAGGSDNSAWNTGFLDADPLDLPANGSINNHVLVPDTYTTPVPEPGTLLLVGTGLASAGAWSRKRWFGRKSA